MTLPTALMVLLPGAMNPQGWGIAAVYLFFIAGFGYFAHLKKHAG